MRGTRQSADRGNIWIFFIDFVKSKLRKQKSGPWRNSTRISRLVVEVRLKNRSPYRRERYVKPTNSKRDKSCLTYGAVQILHIHSDFATQHCERSEHLQFSPPNADNETVGALVMSSVVRVVLQEFGPPSVNCILGPCQKYFLQPYSNMDTISGNREQPWKTTNKESCDAWKQLQLIAHCTMSYLFFGAFFLFLLLVVRWWWWAI